MMLLADFFGWHSQVAEIVYAPKANQKESRTSGLKQHGIEHIFVVYSPHTA